jgi:hypothetical protein
MPYGDSMLSSSSLRNAGPSSLFCTHGASSSLNKLVRTPHACVADSPVQESAVWAADRSASGCFKPGLDTHAPNVVVVRTPPDPDTALRR